MGNIDDCIGKIRAFLALKPAEQRQAKADLQRKITSRAEEMVSVEKQADDLAKDLEREQAGRDAVSKEIAQLSAKIPKILAFDQDAEEAKTSHRKLIEESNSIGHVCTGLAGRINDLKNELPILRAEQEEDSWTLKLYRLIPLPDELNEAFAKVIGKVEELHDAVEDLGSSIHPGASGLRVVSVSDWDLIQKIPKFYLLGCEKPGDRKSGGGLKDLWSYDVFKSERRAKRQTATEE